jgi:1,4-dihydroxy-2-naphthoate octaprenyltransferase
MAVKAIKAFNGSAPSEPPADYPVWPLWWAPIAFLHTRRAGGLLLAGLLAWSIWVGVR